jgi:hypothetical protein
MTRGRRASRDGAETTARHTTDYLLKKCIVDVSATIDFVSISAPLGAPDSSSIKSTFSGNQLENPSWSGVLNVEETCWEFAV